VRLAIAVASLGAALLGGACGDGRPAASPTEAISPSPTPSTPQDASAAPSTSAPVTPVAYDPSLLELLPARVDGIPLVGDPDAAAAMGEDPALVEDAEALAAATVVGDGGDDFAVVAVVRFEPGVLDDGYFRDWRDSYDDGACSQAGGVAGNAQAQLGGHAVYIGSCVGGLRTYHVWLPDRDVLVSVSALGERRLGERLTGEVDE
jgi:hypothetical protein